MGWVYYIACVETKLVKIGFTKGSPYDRLKALQTGSAADLVLMATHPGTLAEEQSLHQKFAELRVRGEWFKMSEAFLEHLSMIVWLSAADCQIRNRDPEPWLVVGLGTMNDESPLPPDKAALLQDWRDRGL